MTSETNVKTSMAHIIQQHGHYQLQKRYLQWKYIVLTSISYRSKACSLTDVRGLSSLQWN